MENQTFYTKSKISAKAVKQIHGNNFNLFSVNINIIAIFSIHLFYENTMSEKVSFKSRINFVDRAMFDKIKRGTKILYKHDTPNIIKDNEFFTEEIRTCSGGGLVKPFVEADGFHLMDDVINFNNLHDFLVYLFRYVKNADRGLLLGSKELGTRPYSVKVFEKIKKAFLARIPNVSLFEGHTYSQAQTHFNYSLKDDTWTICSEYRPLNTKALLPVRTLSELKKVYRNVSIADGDTLFINGKQITPDMAPEIFQSK